MALGGEGGGQIKVRNQGLQTIDRLVKCFPSSFCPVKSVLENQEGWLALKSPSTINLVSTVLHEGIEIREQDNAKGT